MKDLTKTARILDKLCHILAIALKVASICIIVCLCILAAGYLFDLDPYIIGTNYEEADLGFVTLHVAQAYMPDHMVIWAQAAAEMLLTLLCLIFAHFIVKSFRAILSPMKDGQPFHNTVSIHLGKIARYVCAFGIGMNLQTIISNILIVKAFDLNLLLVSERIPHAEFHFSFDLTFLVVAAVFLLLSYVFRYGEELQQLSDETL